jgi:hypothetical protein
MQCFAHHFLFYIFFVHASMTQIYKKENAPFGAFIVFGGERGIRTPGPVTVNGFQDRRIRPLCHLSGTKIQKITESNRIYLFFFKKVTKKVKK